jgi:hypothetical protein
VAITVLVGQSPEAITDISDVELTKLRDEVHVPFPGTRQCAGCADYFGFGGFAHPCQTWRIADRAVNRAASPAAVSS